MRVSTLAVLVLLSLVLASSALGQASRTTQTGVMGAYRVRAVGGDLDGRGYLWIEAYRGDALETTWHVTDVWLGETRMPFDVLRGIALGDAREAGFAFSATLGSAPMTCTALLWADSSAVCRPASEPAPSPRTQCEAEFSSVGGLRQCEVTYANLRGQGRDADGLLQACVGAFRAESHRNDCYLAALDPTWTRAFPACIRAFDETDGRRLCLFATINTVGRDRIDTSVVEGCVGAAHDDDAARCLFGGAPQPPSPAGVGPVDPVERAWPLDDAMRSPPSGPTQLVTRTLPAGPDVVTAYGGMLDGEPVLFFEHRPPTMPDLLHRTAVDWLRVGGTVRALREVTSLEVLSTKGEALSFRVTLDGRARRCRVAARQHDARCR
jgi:hypothetical protein